MILQRGNSLILFQTPERSGVQSSILHGVRFLVVFSITFRDPMMIWRGIAFNHLTGIYKARFRGVEKERNYVLPSAFEKEEEEESKKDSPHRVEDLSILCIQKLLRAKNNHPLKLVTRYHKPTVDEEGNFSCTAVWDLENTNFRKLTWEDVKSDWLPPNYFHLIKKQEEVQTIRALKHTLAERCAETCFKDKPKLDVNSLIAGLAEDGSSRNWHHFRVEYWHDANAGLLRRGPIYMISGKQKKTLITPSAEFEFAVPRPRSFILVSRDSTFTTLLHHED